MVQVKINHSVLGELRLEVSVDWREWQGSKLGEMVFTLTHKVAGVTGEPGDHFGGWDEEQGGGLGYDLEKDERGYLELEDKLYLAVIPHFPYFFSLQCAGWKDRVEHLKQLETERQVDPRTSSDKDETELDDVEYCTRHGYDLDHFMATGEHVYPEDLKEYGCECGAMSDSNCSCDSMADCD